VSPDEFRGRKLVLRLRSRDDTPGRTEEAGGIAERLDEFRAGGAEGSGLSKDAVAAHDEFVAKRTAVGAPSFRRSREAESQWSEARSA